MPLAHAHWGIINTRPLFFARVRLFVSLCMRKTRPGDKASHGQTSAQRLLSSYACSPKTLQQHHQFEGGLCCFCKSASSLSLNDLLSVGPTVHTTLFVVLLRFRLHSQTMSAGCTMQYFFQSLTTIYIGLCGGAAEMSLWEILTWPEYHSVYTQRRQNTHVMS